MPTPDMPPPERSGPGPPDESFDPPQPTGGGEPPPREIVLPRGCNPLTFGVVMATLEMGILLVLWQRCR